MKITYTILFLLLGCSGSNFSSGSDKDKSSKQPSEGDGKPKKSVPPEEVTGAFLACDVVDNGTGSNSADATFGCSAKNKSGSTFNLDNLDVAWSLNDKKGQPIEAKKLPVPEKSEYHVMWSFSRKYVMEGYSPGLKFNAKSSNPILIKMNDDTRKCSSKLLADGRLFRTCVKYDSKYGYISFNLYQSPFNTLNHLIETTRLDEATGICGEVISRTYGTPKAPFENMAEVLVSFEGGIAQQCATTEPRLFSSSSNSSQRQNTSSNSQHLSESEQSEGINFCIKVTSTLIVNGSETKVVTYAK